MLGCCCGGGLHGTGLPPARPPTPKGFAHVFLQGRAAIASFLVDGCDVSELEKDLNARHIAVRRAPAPAVPVCWLQRGPVASLLAATDHKALPSCAFPSSITLVQLGLSSRETAAYRLSPNREHHASQLLRVHQSGGGRYVHRRPARVRGAAARQGRRRQHERRARQRLMRLAAGCSSCVVRASSSPLPC